MVEGYFEDFDNPGEDLNDPEFMKRQMEEYERIQKEFQQQRDGGARD